MGKFDNATRKECITGVSDRRHDIHICKAEHKATGALEPKAEELRLRGECIEIWQRLVQIEVEERDACSIALQRATLEAEEERGEAS